MGHPFKHFRTITHHRHLVIRICFRLGIGFQGLFHDLSKYSYTEFHSGAKYYAGVRSPNAIEREKFGYSRAWLHHKGRNRHHFEYWYDVSIVGKYVPLKMPIRYLKEMFADRIAASKTYQKEKYTDASALNYLLTRENEQLMHPDTYREIKRWLEMLRDEGEKKTFKTVKEQKSY